MNEFMTKFKTNFVIGIAALLATTSLPLGSSMADDVLVIEQGNEAKIEQFTHAAPFNEQLEASGVLVDDNFFLIVFDNINDKIARIHNTLKYHPENGFIDLKLAPSAESGIEGFEGLARDDGKVYALVESYDKGKAAAVFTYTGKGEEAKLERLPMDDSHFKDPDSKGFEGIAFWRQLSETYLLALCEGNKCKKGGDNDKGKIWIFKKNGANWEKPFPKPISLTGQVDFKDYSGLAVSNNGRLAIVSQEDSKIWIGGLNTSTVPWTLKPGKVYLFPRANSVTCSGKTYPVPGVGILYKNIEGVDWIGENKIVTVTDRRKKWKKIENLPYSCKDQSIQVITIP